MKVKIFITFQVFAIFGVVWVFKSVDSATSPYKIETSVSGHQNHVYSITRLIKDWNEKHNEVCNVLYFDIGEKSDLTNELLRKIPKENAVTLVKPDKCRILENREGAFIIIESDVFQAVSII